MAQRIEREVGDVPESQFQRAWQLAFGRTPSASEAKQGLAFLAEQTAILKGDAGEEAASQKPAPAHRALSSLCQALVISNGFIYVE
jgi:hypothetical protein